MVAKNDEKKVAVILHFDVWDEEGNRLTAGPVVGKNAVGGPIREKIDHVTPALAKELVVAGKAEVPLEG